MEEWSEGTHAQGGHGGAPGAPDTDGQGGTSHRRQQTEQRPLELGSDGSLGAFEDACDEGVVVAAGEHRRCGKALYGDVTIVTGHSGTIGDVSQNGVEGCPAEIDRGGYEESETAKGFGVAEGAEKQHGSTRTTEKGRENRGFVSERRDFDEQGGSRGRGIDRHGAQGSEEVSTVGVRSIKPIGVRRIYDITVAEDESYLCCGVYSHNSSGPNLQNIPRESEKLPSIRKAFKCRPGFVIMDIDYGQIELRLGAHYTKDPAMLEILRKHKGDLHQQSADEWGITRQEAKTTNFAVWYGLGAASLAALLDITEKQAKTLMLRYFTRFCYVKPWQKAVVRKARLDGFVTTLIGRRRYLPGITSRRWQERGPAERRAVNTKIQGSAGDIIKIAMRNLSEEMKRRDWFRKDVFLLSQVHDELIFEVRDGMQYEVGPVCQQVMESAVTLRVPVIAEPGYGMSWAEAH